MLEHLVANLVPHGTRTIDRGGPGIMAVHVECLGLQLATHQLRGVHYSVAHYYTAGGDLVADPDVLFVHVEAGWVPLAIQDTFSFRTVVTIDDAGRGTLDDDLLVELIDFCETWMANIREQQSLTVETPL